MPIIMGLDRPRFAKLNVTPKKDLRSLGKLFISLEGQQLDAQPCATMQVVAFRWFTMG